VSLPLDSIVVTGANGQLGRALLSRLAQDGRTSVRALVRSESARDTILSLGLSPAPDIRIVDYTSPKEMRAALEGARAVVHLVGIIKETPGSSYIAAHEQSCHALAVAASRSGIERIVYLSILGSAPDAKNPCLASKGRAESLLLENRAPTTVIRVPMVIGGDDPASASLRRQAQARSLWMIGGGRTLQQPIDARDVVRAILSACSAEPRRDLILDAAGPECISHRNLVLRAARLWNNEPKIKSLPISLVRFAVGILDRALRNPPVSRPMFEILQHDDRVDISQFCRVLDLELTPLDTTLADLIRAPALGAPQTTGAADTSGESPQPDTQELT
jgi:NADH dehydrogenase